MFKRILEAYQAWRRSERRIAPKGVRGRVYERKSEPGNIATKTTLKPTMNMRIYRAKENSWYRRNPNTDELEKEE